jgi:Asp-tRNA(Asn)/Glu-tRNA(Gln) amidotransferase A subunit family amidase
MPIMATGTPPISVQLIGPEWSEALLLATAQHLETEGVVGFSPPPHQFI